MNYIQLQEFELCLSMYVHNRYVKYNFKMVTLSSHKLVYLQSDSSQ